MHDNVISKMTGMRNNFLKGWYLSFLLLNNRLNYVGFLYGVCVVYMCCDTSVGPFNFYYELNRSNVFITLSMRFLQTENDP